MQDEPQQAFNEPDLKRGRRKICHVAATDDGATWMFEQLRELRDRYGYDVVAVVSAERGRLIDKLKSAGIRYHVANFAAGAGSLTQTLTMPLAILKLALFFRREKFDVVHHHIFITMRVVRPAAWLADVPIRVSMIAGPFHLQASTSRWIERLTCWMDSILVPSCQKSLDLLRELGVRRNLGPVIYYGPDERNFDPALVRPLDIRGEFGWPASTHVVSLAAFFYPRLSRSSWVPPEVRGRGIKGHGDLVKAARIILEEFPDAKFLLVGSGWGAYGEKYLKEVKQLVREMYLEASVLFPGFRADHNRILRASDVAVQASLNENLGGTIESLLLMCPTVATRVGGLVDTVIDGETGVLVNPSDPQDLARGIIRLLRDPKSARTFGKAGRQRMLQRFTLQHTVSDLSRLYDRLIESTDNRRQYYNPLVSAARLLLAIPLFAYMSLRLFLVDGYLFYKVGRALYNMLQRGSLKRREPAMLD
jgi:glycosyltransferase involved in cell wall biosynthesis